MKLLMITRKVSASDALAGFTYNWVKKLSEHLDFLYVIAWQESNGEGLPDNVQVISLPQIKWKKIVALYQNGWRLLPQVNGVFCHMNPEYTILIGPLARLRGKKIVSWYTHKAVTWRRRLLELFANKIITASAESFRTPWFPQKVEVIGHGIDIDWFAPKEKTQSDIFTILTVGRISPVKRYENMIEVLALLNNKSVHLKIVGDVVLKEQEDYLQNLKDLATKRNVAEQVHFLGWIANKDTVSFYQDADLFINLSQTGSLDKAILEAMACGCLVLTSNEAFAPLLEDRYFLKDDGPAAISNKIKLIMDMGAQARHDAGNDLRAIVVKQHNLSVLTVKIIKQFYQSSHIFKKIKLELFYWKKSFLEYRQGFLYIKNKYFVARQILRTGKSFEKPVTNSDLSMHVLVCHRDVVAAVWALASFYKVSKNIGILFIHDDGTLTEKDKGYFHKFFPGATIVSTQDFVEKNYARLGEYPDLKYFRITHGNYFSFKKIIDPYFVSDKKMRLILDTDILWFDTPVELGENIKNGCPRSYMQDNGMPIYATFKDGLKMDDRLARANAGIMLYNIYNFDVSRFTTFLKTIDLSNASNLHFADQAGHAFSLDHLDFLPIDRYSIKKTVDVVTVARHYTSPRRPLFYIEGIEKLKNLLS